MKPGPPAGAAAAAWPGVGVEGWFGAAAAWLGGAAGAAGVEVEVEAEVEAAARVEASSEDINQPGDLNWYWQL